MFVKFLFFSLFNNFAQLPLSRGVVKLAVVLLYFRLEQNAKSTTNQNVELNFVHRELAFSLGPGFTESSVTIIIYHINRILYPVRCMEKPDIKNLLKQECIPVGCEPPAPSLPVDRQTPVKILPCLKLRLRVVKILIHQ